MSNNTQFNKSYRMAVNPTQTNSTAVMVDEPNNTNIIDTSKLAQFTGGDVLNARPVQQHRQNQNYYNSNYENKVYYKLEKVEAAQTLEDIKTLTNGFSVELGITPEFVEKLTARVTERGYAFRGFLYAPKNTDVTKQVIGKGGCYFHQTTEKCNIDFIWHNRENYPGKFEFWGDKKEVIKAMDIIRSRIYNHNEQAYQQSRNNYSNKPRYQPKY